jgi:uncharacterized protein (DUF488 family)
LDKRVWTIGHSTRSIEEFIALLREHRIEELVDVRRFPASRKHPQFNAEALDHSLGKAGIAYLGLTELGGRRPARRDSPNVAWRNASFRGYADYMETPAFAAGLENLMGWANKRRTAMMCAESLWWQCHRALISDALKVRGYEVCHILKPGGACELHPYSAAATVAGGKLSYDGGQGRLT